MHRHRHLQKPKTEQQKKTTWFANETFISIKSCVRCYRIPCASIIHVFLLRIGRFHVCIQLYVAYEHEIKLIWNITCPYRETILPFASNSTCNNNDNCSFDKAKENERNRTANNGINHATAERDLMNVSFLSKQTKIINSFRNQKILINFALTDNANSTFRSMHSRLCEFCQNINHFIKSIQPFRLDAMQPERFPAQFKIEFKKKKRHRQNSFA